MKKTLILLSIITVIQTNAMNIQTATFGSGCFWCTEAIFQEVKGVSAVVSGYMGGKNENPTYEQVCSGNSGYAEVVQITYDADIVSYDLLLEIFWKTHDPTTLNKQGADEGTQYRSVVFYHSENQKTIAEKYKQILDAEKIWENPIVTEISKASKFYSAESYHQDYYKLNKTKNSYCTFVISPKVEKFKKIFKTHIK